MRVAIVVPEAAAGTRGGAERAWEGLRAAIERLTDHHAEIVGLRVEEHNLVDLLDAYRRFAALDLSEHDLVITSKYPAWLAHHPHHVVHLFHPLRGLYDTYHLTGLPPSRVGRPRSAALAQLLDLVRRPLGNDPRAGLDDLFGAFDLAAAELGRDHPELALPGPVARELVHRLDAVALHPSQVRRHLALSRTVAGRPDYFPLGITPDIVHLPSDLPGLSPGPAAGRTGFFTASRIDGPKRLDLLVEAMAHVTADAGLTIAGAGPDLDRLRRMVGSDERITFLGPASDSELARRYRTALAVPFVPRDEDYGLITVEAFASGTPVLTTTDSGGPTELVVNGVSGLVVPPDPHAVARAFDHLAADPSWAAHLGANGQRRADEITWESAVAAILGDAAPEVAAAATPDGPQRRRYVVPSTYAIDPPRGGGQLRYRHLYGALARHADVHIVSLVNPPRPTRTSTIAPGLTETVVGVSEEQLHDDVRLTHATGIPTTDIVAGRSIRSTPAYVDELRRALSDADAVILSHPFLLPALEAAGSELPFVYDAHNAEAEMKADVLGGSAAGRELAAWTAEVEGRAVQRATHVVACSDEDVATLRRWFPRDESAFVVIPNGTDADRVVPTPEERRERSRAWRAAWATAQEVDPPVAPEGLAVFFASWHPPNNDAAEVLISIAPQLPEVVFVLAGSHSDLFRTRALPTNIVLAGVVSDAAKATLLAAADLAVNPMRLGSGTNLKIVEYFAAGVPAVSTPFGVRGLDVSGDHLVLAEIDDLPTAIRAVLADPGAAATRAAAARALVLERYDWGALGDTLAELLEGDL
jgi:glycosyltransferase involved in cell wall biosynthesis